MHVILLLATAGHWIGILFKWKWKQWMWEERGGVARCASSTLVFWVPARLKSFLSSDVREVRPRGLPGLVALFWFRCWSERQNKSRAYWFLKHCLSHSAYCPLPPATHRSILLDLPSHLLHVWHAAILPVAQGRLRTFSIKKNNNNPSSFPLARALCINVSPFRVLMQLSFCTSLPFPSRHKIQRARLSHSLTADSLKNSFNFPILLTRLYDCLRAKRVVPVYVDSAWVSRNANEERCLLPTKKILSSRSLCSLSTDIKNKITHKARRCSSNLYFQFAHTQRDDPPLLLQLCSLDEPSLRALKKKEEEEKTLQCSEDHSGLVVLSCSTFFLRGQLMTQFDKPLLVLDVIK